MDLVIPITTVVALVTILFGFLGFTFYLQKPLIARIDKIDNKIDAGFKEFRDEFTKLRAAIAGRSSSG